MSDHMSSLPTAFQVRDELCLVTPATTPSPGDTPTVTLEAVATPGDTFPYQSAILELREIVTCPTVMGRLEVLG